MSREKEAGAILEKCAPMHQYTITEIHMIEEVKEVRREFLNVKEGNVKFSPIAIFDSMVTRKGNIAVTMGLIHWCDLYKEDSTGENLEELAIWFLNFTIDSQG